MGASSTHHITVTKQMMARKKARRSKLNQRKEASYKGKFGNLKVNMLADRFRSKKGHVVKEQDYLSATDKAYIWVVLVSALLVSVLLYWIV